MESSGNAKVFTLISDDHIYFVIKKELRKIGFEVEGLLSAIPHCAFIILDHGAVELDIVNYLTEEKYEKPALLILTEMQAYSSPIQFSKRFHDVLMVPDHERFESGRVVSAHEGEVPLQSIFKRVSRDHDSQVLPVSTQLRQAI